MTTGLRYLLDTNIVSDIARHPNGLAAQRLIEVGVEYAGISIVVACEIRFGLAKSGAHRIVDRLTQVLAQCKTLSLEPPVDEHYGDIRNRLERTGRSIGPNDLLNRTRANLISPRLRCSTNSPASRSSMSTSGPPMASP